MTGAPGVFRFHSVCFRLDVYRMRHRYLRIILSECNSRYCGNSQLRDQLSNENNASPLRAPHIEAKINLFERAVERNCHAGDACVVEFESDKTDIGTPFECIEFRTQRNEAPKQAWVNYVIEHQQVAPIGRQKDTGLLHVITLLHNRNAAGRPPAHSWNLMRVSCVAFRQQDDIRRQPGEEATCTAVDVADRWNKAS